ALKFYQQAAARMLTGGGEPLSPYTILLLLGRKEEAVAASREIRKRMEHPPSAEGDWQQRLLDYDCGLISADELLNFASPSRLYQSRAHFRIGLRLLADRDRVGARDHFRRCVAIEYFKPPP